MKQKVYKYKIEIEGYQEIEMPFGAKILTFQLQRGVPHIWVLLEPSIETTVRRFRLVGTGFIIKEGGLQYIGTVKMLDDTITYHLFEY